ncbi:MAG TPA: HAD family hydrolase [Candidatus Mediterraneibacter norwichensis]|nr:HAD family hydrolase [Candidatus Mediterraneibacter norwichensis]
MDSIIFDVDGTLWDSTDSVARSWNLAIQENSSLDLTITENALQQVFGKTMTEIADTLFSRLPEKERMKLLEVCFQYENRYLETHPGKLFDGVTDTLAALSGQYPLFIVSNCQQGYIEVLLRTCSLEPFIKDHLCFGETQTSKGQTILTLMKRNGLKNPVYVGDTRGDADACAEAGIPFIFAGYGFGDVPDAKMRISKFTDLKDLVCQL